MSSRKPETPAPPFQVTHSILEPQALASWAETHYPLAGGLKASFFRQSMSHVYNLDTSETGYILKVYLRRRHDRASIQAEVDFLNDLLAEGIPVAAPLQGRDGNWVKPIEAPEGTRWAVLFERVKGCQPKETDLDHSRLFGELAARIHNCADRSGKHYNRWHLDEGYLLEAPLEIIGRYFPQRAKDLEYLRTLAGDLAGELVQLLPKRMPVYGLCHGDLHTGNAQIIPGKGLTLFDFESCGYGWRALDIGVYRASYDWMDLSQKTQRIKDRFWEAFLSGYNHHRTLSKNEVKAVNLCLPLRHFELMGVTMRYWAPYEGVNWISDDYFNRHLDWFKEWADGYRKPSPAVL